MYSKQEAAILKQQFWTAFGQYMSPVLSAEGEHINWLNYKTGEKHIYFRLNADNKKATVAIELTHSDVDLQSLYFRQFEELKDILHKTLNEDWTWLPATKDEHNKTVSCIYVELNNVNIFQKDDWPKLISFFKPRIVALDEFWSNAKYAFEVLR